MEFYAHSSSSGGGGGKADALINPLHSLPALKLLEFLSFLFIYFFLQTPPQTQQQQQPRRSLFMWEVLCNSIRVHPSSTTRGAFVYSRLVVMPWKKRERGGKKKEGKVTDRKHQSVSSLTGL